MSGEEREVPGEGESSRGDSGSCREETSVVAWSWLLWKESLSLLSRESGLSESCTLGIFPTRALANLIGVLTASIQAV